MNPQDHDHPDLTAYALGELAPADAEQVRRWLAQSPEARAEFERVQQMLGFLQDAPALPKRSLHPRQRETVLAMGQAPATVARPKNVVPFLGFRRPAGSGTRRSSTAWSMVKFAAAACLVAGAFMLGQKTSTQITPLVANQDTPEPATPNAGTAEVKTMVPTAPETVHVAEATTPAPKLETIAPVAPAPKLAENPAPAVPAPSPAPAVIAATKPTPAPAPQPVAASPPAPAPVVAAAKPAPPSSAPLSFKGFAQTSTSPEAILTVHPQAIRPLPLPHEFAGVVLASPLPPDAKPAQAPRKPESQPALIVHWGKPEIASCPWDSSRRLVRFVAQVPLDQPGIESSDSDYKLVTKFDPFHVQGFRLVMDKHMRASGGGTQATRFAWYEIIPTRNFNASADKPVTIGTISIEQPRGAESDIQPLKLVDRGLAWDDASEVFIFETAMIGWHMLLNGADNISGLNSKLVLNLAQRTRGDDSDDRVKFINAVKQARKTVGMDDK